MLHSIYGVFKSLLGPGDINHTAAPTADKVSGESDSCLFLTDATHFVSRRAPNEEAMPIPYDSKYCIPKG